MDKKTMDKIQEARKNRTKDTLMTTIDDLMDLYGSTDKYHYLVSAKEVILAALDRYPELCRDKRFKEIMSMKKGDGIRTYNPNNPNETVEETLAVFKDVLDGKIR